MLLLVAAAAAAVAVVVVVVVVVAKINASRHALHLLFLDSFFFNKQANNTT